MFLVVQVCGDLLFSVCYGVVMIYMFRSLGFEQMLQTKISLDDVIGFCVFSTL